MLARRIGDGEMMQLGRVFPTGISVSASPRMRAALLLAILADITQMIAFPLFMEGAASPAEDVLDLCMAGVLGLLLGWHWEFLPSFAGKLVPGVDLVPLWTLAVANVYRKSKEQVIGAEASGEKSARMQDGQTGR